MHMRSITTGHKGGVAIGIGSHDRITAGKFLRHEPVIGAVSI